jgi:hypothetical protein
LKKVLRLGERVAVRVADEHEEAARDSVGVREDVRRQFSADLAFDLENPVCGGGRLPVA